jgi:hypothetical protein
LSFISYLTARFLVGPASIGRESQRESIAERTIVEPPAL